MKNFSLSDAELAVVVGGAGQNIQPKKTTQDGRTVWVFTKKQMEEANGHPITQPGWWQQ
jgi:hypothetical protein